MRPAPGVSVALLRPLAELLGRIDVDPEGFLRSLSVDEATSPETYIPADVVDRTLDDIAAARRDPALGLTLARLSTVRPLGMFGHLVWLSGTLRDALARAVKFYGFITQRTTLALVEDAGVATLRQQPASTRIARGRVLTEMPFASLALRAREATGGAFALRAARFAHRGTSTPAYRDVFGVDVEFGAAADELVFAASLLDLPLATMDPITSAALEASVAARLGPGHSPLVDRIRRAIARSEGTPSLAAVARDVGVSVRTLRRRLQAEGASLRAVIDDVRRERADELLATGTPIKEVAFALGFSEPSAFSRAYKRWTGRPPKHSP